MSIDEKAFKSLGLTGDTFIAVHNIIQLYEAAKSAEQPVELPLLTRHDLRQGIYNIIAEQFYPADEPDHGVGIATDSIMKFLRQYLTSPKPVVGKREIVGVEYSESGCPTLVTAPSKHKRESGKD